MDKQTAKKPLSIKVIDDEMDNDYGHVTTVVIRHGLLNRYEKKALENAFKRFKGEVEDLKRLEPLKHIEILHAISNIEP